MAAVAVGTDDCGDRAWRRMVCGGGIPDRLQHRSRGASLVGAQRRMDIRRARERGTAQPMLQKALALLGPAMAFAVGFALPLAARFLAVPFPRWGQLAAVVTAGAGVPAARLARG